MTRVQVSQGLGSFFINISILLLFAPGTPQGVPGKYFASADYAPEPGNDPLPIRLSAIRPDPDGTPIGRLEITNAHIYLHVLVRVRFTPQ